MKKILLTVSLIMLMWMSLMLYVSADGGSATPSVSSISVSSYPDKTVYGAFEHLDTTGLSLRVVFTDGSEKIINGKDIRVSYNRDNCFRVGDSSVLLSYGGKSLYLPITVNRIAYDLSVLALEDFSVTYNGKYQTYNSPLSQIVGLDGIALSVNFSGGGTNVGIYDVKVDFHTESIDYFAPESRVIGMTIEPKYAQVVWEGSSFVYDGKSKSPTAYFTDVNGSKVYLAVSGASTNAGSGYIARATTNDLNYEYSNTSTSYEIRKADIDLSAVSWSKDSFVYDGSKKSVSASGLPSGISIIGYSGDIAEDAGIYTATAMLRWDENNYNPPPVLTHIWEITKADYDMSSISFRSETFVFDGAIHYPTLIGDMPIGADGISLEYSFSSGACHVTDGRVSVIISFHTSSKNYNIPTERYSSVIVTPKGITVEWGDRNLSYNGENQSPVAFAEECSIKVSGAAVNVGKYLATATTDNSDYFIINDKLEYSIRKAQNYWDITPADSICYEGKEIVLKGTSRFGDIDITFYADKDCKERVSKPSTCGLYYATLSVKECDNYSGLTSEVISFEIVEIKPVSFFAEITKESIKAFDVLSNSDFVCTVINNDGSESHIDPALVQIVYENKNSFRRGDEWVRLQYDGFVFTLPIEVSYADYDLSEVRWINTSQVYNGDERSPAVIGLPDGVSVVEYIGGNKTNAGSYTVYASLEYDRDNYNEPVIPHCEFVIKKCVLTPPLIQSIYNGNRQIAVSASDLYTIATEDGFTYVGEYIIPIRLTDPNNYSFSDGNDAYAIFKIVPAKLSVTVSDVRLKLFEKLGGVEYIITSGVIYGEDSFSVTPYAEGKRVLVRSDNPNYSLDVTSGRIIRLPYPTLQGGIIIMLSILIILALMLGVLVALRNRHRIVSMIAMLRCRWHNRNYKAPMPIQVTETTEEDIGIAESFDMEIEILDATIGDSDEDEDREEIEYNERKGELSLVDFEIDAERADGLITDSLAKSLINREGEIIYTRGSEKEIINVELLSKNFEAGERVDVNSLKKKGLISSQTAYIKVLGGGKIDKPLMVFANDFSLSAVKMIALTGGKVIKVVTFKERNLDEKE